MQDLKTNQVVWIEPCPNCGGKKFRNSGRWAGITDALRCTRCGRIVPATEIHPVTKVEGQYDVL